MNKIFDYIFKEALKNSAGYLAGLSSSMLVSQFFVKRGVSNLWGLTTKREAVSKDNYEWIMYVTSYVVGLVVMTLVNNFLKKLGGKEE